MQTESTNPPNPATSLLRLVYIPSLEGHGNEEMSEAARVWSPQQILFRTHAYPISMDVLWRTRYDHYDCPRCAASHGTCDFVKKSRKMQVIPKTCIHIIFLDYRSQHLTGFKKATTCFCLFEMIFSLTSNKLPGGRFMWQILSQSWRGVSETPRATLHPSKTTLLTKGDETNPKKLNLLEWDRMERSSGEVVFQ